MNREIVWTAQFKKDDKLAMKRHMDMDLLDHIIRALSRGETLPERNKDHSLTGDWVGHRECHIQPDWLLAYRMEEDVLVLTLARTGTHSDLFGKSSDTAVWEAKHPVRRFCTPKGRGTAGKLGGFGGFSWRAHTVRLCSGFARLGKICTMSLEHTPMPRGMVCVVRGQAAGEVIGDAGVEGAVPALEDVNSPHGGLLRGMSGFSRGCGRFAGEDAGAPPWRPWRGGRVTCGDS